MDNAIVFRVYSGTTTAISIRIRVVTDREASISEYTRNGLVVSGDSIDKIIADRLFTVLSSDRCNRAADLYDLYVTLSNTENYDIVNIVRFLMSAHVGAYHLLCDFDSERFTEVFTSLWDEFIPISCLTMSPIKKPGLSVLIDLIANFSLLILKEMRA